MGSDEHAVHLTRTIHAPARCVFAAWIDARQLERWLTQTAQTDPRIGGRFRLEVRKDEATHVVTGEYLELVPGRRIVKTWNYEGPYSPEGRMEARLAVEFREKGQSTELSLRHEALTSPRYREAIQQGAWSKALDKLELILITTPPAYACGGVRSRRRRPPPNQALHSTGGSFGVFNH